MRLILFAMTITCSLCSYGQPDQALSDIPSMQCTLAQLASGRTTSTALVTRYINQARRNKHLNAWITLDADGALQHARTLDKLRKQSHLLGPLHGVALAIKDNIHVAGLPNTGGTSTLKQFVPTTDAVVIRQLKQAGAIILGKTNMHEMAYGITSNNYAFGAVGNAHNAKYIGGGSSGGTAVAVAAGMASAGLGTDTGGSSRIPAALNGIVGYRPTTGRYSADGLLSISSTRDTIGPMASTVADIVLLDKVMSNHKNTITPALLQGVRLGIPRIPFYDSMESDVKKAMDNTLKILADSGVILVEADMPDLHAINEKVGFPIVIYETGQLMQQYIVDNQLNVSMKKWIADIASPDVKAIMGQVAAQSVSEETYNKAKQHYRPQLQQLYRDYFTKHNVEAILFPTTVLTARPIKDSLNNVTLNSKPVPTFATYIKNTDPGSNAGIPGMSLPIGAAANGLPIGVELDGPQNSDQRLLALGLAIEKLIDSTRQDCK